MRSRHAAIRGAHETGDFRRCDPQAIAGFGGVKRASPKPANGTASPLSTTTAINPVGSGGAESARESTNGKIIAVVQPHRFTRLQSLFEEFCTAFNDADTVVVAEVYPAGEAPIPGIDRDHLSSAARARPSRGDPIAEISRSLPR